MCTLCIKPSLILLLQPIPMRLPTPIDIRPTEVDTLLGDPSDAEERLVWKPKTSFEELVRKGGGWDRARPDG